MHADFKFNPNSVHHSCRFIRVTCICTNSFRQQTSTYKITTRFLLQYVLFFQDRYAVNYTCVVFPEPVSPTRTKALFSFIPSMNFSLYSHTGSSILFLRISKYLSENSLPLKGLIFPRRLLGLLTKVKKEKSDLIRKS